MANCSSFWRPALLTAGIALACCIVFPAIVVAQGRGDRPADAERGDRPDRGGRGGGGRWGGERGRGRDRDPNRDSGNDERGPESRPATATPAAAPTASSFGTVPESERIRKFASDTLKKHDADGNGILEGEELKDLGTSRNADKDGDGKITHNELVALYTPTTASTSTSTVSPAATKPAAESKPSSDSSAKSLIVNTSRKSYRFKSTKERINSWKFSSKDANGDGQVSMSEYSSSWSDRTASEFQRYDKDNDGMITVEEAK
jgi:Ca2+-binding EF-hand superfamily protein